MTYLAISAILLSPGSHHKGIIDRGACNDLSSCLCQLVIIAHKAR